MRRALRCALGRRSSARVDRNGVFPTLPKYNVGDGRYLCNVILEGLPAMSARASTCVRSSAESLPKLGQAADSG